MEYLTNTVDNFTEVWMNYPVVLVLSLLLLLFVWEFMVRDMVNDLMPKSVESYIDYGGSQRHSTARSDTGAATDTGHQRVARWASTPVQDNLVGTRDTPAFWGTENQDTIDKLALEGMEQPSNVISDDKLTATLFQ
jgi:hypothetical protein